MSETTTIAVVSDLHCGSTVALCPPRIELDDGGAYEASKAQRWLWQCWGDYWDRVEQARTDKLYVVFNGDLVDGDHHNTPQILSRNPTAQAMVVDAALKIPLALDPDRLFVVRGTASHVGQSGSSEERIAQGLSKDGRPVIGDPDASNASWFHLRMDVYDHRLAFAHHGRTGFRPWTRANALNLLAAQIFYEHASRGERHPDLAVRSHFHKYGDSYRAHPVRVVQTPCWQLHTGWTHQKVTEELADIGGMIITVRPGHVDVEPVLFKADRGSIWTESA